MSSKVDPCSPLQAHEVESWFGETDVLVIGYGGAGACAALEANARGKEVTILEVASGGGGTTALSGGQIYLGGGTPTFFSPRNLDRLCRDIFECANVNPAADLSLEGHPVNTSREHLEILYRHGFRRVSFGIQDFDARVQKIIHRIQPLDCVDWKVLNERWKQNSLAEKLTAKWLQQRIADL